MKMDYKKAQVLRKLAAQRRGMVSSEGQLQRQLDDALMKLAHYEALERAEEVILSATERNPRLLAELAAGSVDEFIRKRAQLAMLGHDELEKRASLVSFAAHGGASTTPGVRSYDYDPEYDHDDGGGWGESYDDDGVDYEALIDGNI